MAGILKTTKIKCRDDDGKAKTLHALERVAEEVLANSPGVVQYLVALPLDMTSKNEIYVIEEFESKVALEQYQALQPVKALEALTSDTALSTEPSEVHTGPVAIKTTSGSPLSLSSNPAILLVGMVYKLGTVSKAVAGWKDMAEGAVQSVPGVNVFTVIEDAENSTIRTIEVLDAWESLTALVKTDAAKRNIEHNGKDRTGQKIAIKLHPVAGFVGRLQ